MAEITNKDVMKYLETKPDCNHLTLRERLVLRILLFIVEWLSKDIEGIHTFEIGKIMEEFQIKDKRY